MNAAAANWHESPLYPSNILLQGLPGCIETTALGAAYLAGLATGYWKDKEEIRANWQLQRSFMPSIGETKRKQKLKGWKKAVRAALYFANDEEE